MSDGGKGSSTRPLSVSKEEFDKQWDVIFRAKTPEMIEDAERALQQMVDFNESLGLYDRVPENKE